MTHPLKRYRDRHGLTQESFGTRVGLSKFSISRIEAGLQMPPVATLHRIEMATGGAVTIARLIKAQQALVDEAAA